METDTDPSEVLSALAVKRLTLKAEEALAVMARRDCDSQIVSVFKGLGKLKGEGQSSVRIDGVAKIEVEQSVNRIVPKEMLDDLRKVWNTLTPEQQACFRWVPDVNVANMKALQATNAASFGMISRFIESKPQSPSVKVENLQTPNA